MWTHPLWSVELFLWNRNALTNALEAGEVARMDVANKSPLRKSGASDGSSNGRSSSVMPCYMLPMTWKRRSACVLGPVSRCSAWWLRGTPRETARYTIGHWAPRGDLVPLCLMPVPWRGQCALPSAHIPGRTDVFVFCLKQFPLCVSSDSQQREQYVYFGLQMMGKCFWILGASKTILSDYHSNWLTC